MSKNNITIDDLALMIKGEFDSVKGEFDKSNKKIDGLKRDMAEIKLKFAYVAWAIDVEGLKQRVAALEKKIQAKK